MVTFQVPGQELISERCALVVRGTGSQVLTYRAAGSVFNVCSHRIDQNN